jgi:hypothetical protein
MAVGALISQTLVEAAARDRRMLQATIPVMAGFAEGLRHRAPVRPEVSSAYRRNFRNFEWPTRYWRSPQERWRSWREGESADDQRRSRQEPYFDTRRVFYPEGRASLRL